MLIELFVQKRAYVGLLVYRTYIFYLISHCMYIKARQKLHHLCSLIFFLFFNKIGGACLSEEWIEI